MVGLGPCDPDTKTPSVDSILDLATEAGVLALPLTFARARPAPFHPPRRRARRLRAPPRQADPGWLFEPEGSRHLPRKMRLLNVCNRPTPRAPCAIAQMLESPPPPAFAGHGSFRAARWAETTAESAIE
jgi:hypothetical protein